VASKIFFAPLESVRPERIESEKNGCPWRNLQAVCRAATSLQASKPQEFRLD
jgi:hypothetical protein